MGALFRLLFALLFAVSLSYAQTQYKIVVASYLNKSDADRGLAKLNLFLKNEGVYDKLLKTEAKPISRESGRFYILSIEPFYDKERMLEILRLIRNNYPDAFWNRNEVKTTAPPPKKKEEQKPLPTEVKEPPKIKDIIQNEPKDFASQNTPINEPAAQKTANIEPPSSKSEPEVSRPQLPSYENTKADNPAVPKSFFNEKYLIYLFGILLIALLFLLLFRRGNKNEPLLKENEKLRAEIERIEEFLTKFNHELRTPLNSIIGFTQLSLKKCQDPYILQNLRRINNSSEILLNLVNEMIDFSRLKSGELKPKKRKFNLNEILENVASVISIMAKEKGLEFIFETDKRLVPHLMGDPLKIKQILINLLSNAIKYTQNGSVTLKIELLDKNDSSLKLKFIIEDTGIGMKPEDIDRLFNKFSKPNETPENSPFEGAGLGLVITKELIESMGGTIDITSEYHKGTKVEFVLELPLQNDIDRRLYRLPTDKMLNKRILIIDNFRSYKALSNIFDYFHFIVSHSASFDKAKRELQKSSFDAVYIDENYLDEVVVGELNRLKEEKGFKLALTKDTYTTLEETAQALKIDTMLIKPFTHQSVFDSIIKLFQEEKEPSVEKEKEESEEKYTIVVAEDNSINRQLIKALLKNSKIDAVFVENGEEAVEAVKNNESIKLALLDIEMPKMDGYEAARLIKELKGDDFPVIAHSGFDSDKMEALENNSYFDDYIPKPIEIEKFFDIVEKYLGIRPKEENIGAESFYETYKDAKIKLLYMIENSKNEEAVEYLEGMDRAVDILNLEQLQDLIKKLKTAFESDNKEEVFRLLPYFGAELDKSFKKSTAN